MIFERIMIVWFLLLGSVLSTPTDEFNELTSDGVRVDIFFVTRTSPEKSNSDIKPTIDEILYDLSQKEYISNIVPSRLTSTDSKTKYSRTYYNEEWSDLLKLDLDNYKYFELFDKHVEKGTTARDLTFCIYDDNMREAAVALFRLFQNTDGETFVRVREWAKKNINVEMYMYALRLESVYSTKTNDSTLFPPFVWNPNYFVNAESLAKAALTIDDIVSNPIDQSGEVANKILKMNLSHGIKELVVINSNYSGWNLRKHGNEDLLSYFREDVSLNSYYLGVHLLHPFWMSNEELESINPRYAEHYYYVHKQLMARYNLEKLHVTAKNSSYKFDNCEYVPYLRYKNGLPFPTRYCVLDGWSDEEAYLKTVDIAIRECISRGILIMENGETIAMTTDSHINVLAKLIRANFDGIKFSKTARSVFGYGASVYPINEYNPAPSMLHHPETSLRDPAYWFMIQHMLNYFTDYKNIMEPFDMGPYESEEFEIVEIDCSHLTTYFDFYRFPINQALSNYIKNEIDWLAFIEVRQRRLKRAEFSLNIRVASIIDKDTIVRLYLGPECGDKCWNHYNDFFELDSFRYNLKAGYNNITWSPETSEKFSFDDYYNTALPHATPASKYSIFRFPENLLIPRGLEEGLNLTLFVMITTSDDEELPYKQSFYREVSTELDSKPLGFPFHRQAKNFKDTAFNYKFYNISIYHEIQGIDHNGYGGYFSPHLY